MNYILKLCFLLFVLLAPSVFAITWNSTDIKLAHDQAKLEFNLKKSYQFYESMGDRYKALVQYSKAIRYYQYALIINPSSAEASYNLGVIYYYLKRYQVSISNLEEALSKNFKYEFDRVKQHYLLSICYFHEGMNKKAEAILKALIQEYQTHLDQESISKTTVKPNNYKYAYFLLSLYYRNIGLLGFKNNILNLEKSLKLNYKKPYILYFYYEYYDNLDKKSLAFEYLSRAELLDKKIADKVKNSLTLKNYDIFYEIENQ